MTSERKDELYCAMLGYITEWVNGAELVDILRTVGFTDEEIVEEGFEIEGGN